LLALGGVAANEEKALIYLRAADRFDVRPLAQLRAASLTELGLLDSAGRDAFIASATREFRLLFAHDRIAAWIACDDARVVATTCAVFYDRLPYPDGSRHAELGGVYVMPGYRKRGLATELVREVIAAAQAGGARKTFLRPAKSAKSLYARLGFVDTELMALDARGARAREPVLAALPTG
jgi:GNAT superfamily N-acetyltransferase